MRHISVPSIGRRILMGWGCGRLETLGYHDDGWVEWEVRCPRRRGWADIGRKWPTGPKGIRMVSEGYLEGVAGRSGGGVAYLMGLQGLRAGEDGVDSVGEVAPAVDLLDEAEDDA